MNSPRIPLALALAALAFSGAVPSSDAQASPLQDASPSEALQTPPSPSRVLGLQAPTPRRQHSPRTADFVTILDRTAIQMRKAPRRGYQGRAPVLQATIHVASPRLGEATLALPLAWRMSARGQAPDGDSEPGAPAEQVHVDHELSEALAAQLGSSKLSLALEDALLASASLAGQGIQLADSAVVHEALEFHSRRTRSPGRSAMALTRALTRGNVRDKWSVRTTMTSHFRPKPTPKGLSEEELEARAKRPPSIPSELVDLVPDRLLQVELVALGIHLSDSDYVLPSDFAYMGLRFRIWNLASGARDWDRSVLFGVPLQGAGSDRTSRAWIAPAFARALPRLTERAGELAASALWPETAAPLARSVSFDPNAKPVTSRPEARGPLNEKPAPPLARDLDPSPSGAPSKSGTTLSALLTELARQRLSSPPQAEAWTALRKAAGARLSPSYELVLKCAEDPLGAAIETGALRLGMGRADTYRRVESSRSFRRSLAIDLERQIGEAGHEAQVLAPAARCLLAELTGVVLAPDEARAAAQPLLERAMRDRAYSPESVASLLIAVTLWPEGAETTLQQLLNG